MTCSLTIDQARQPRCPNQAAGDTRPEPSARIRIRQVLARIRVNASNPPALRRPCVLHQAAALAALRRRRE